MSDQGNIPTLTDLIESGDEIKVSDLGFDDEISIKADDPFFDDTEIEVTEPHIGAIDPLADNPELEKTIRRILDEHMELALQEIKLAIQRDLNKL